MKTQISNSIMLAIFINMIYAKAIGVTQGSISREVGGDMWIANLVAILIGLLVMWLVVFVIKRCPEKNILEQAKVLLGAWGERLFALLLFIFFMGAYGGVMITFVYHLMDYFLPDVPIFVFILFTSGVGLYGLSKGIEVIGRFAILGLVAISILNIMILFGSLSHFDVQFFLPVLRYDLLDNLLASRHLLSDLAMGILTLAVVLPMVKQENKWYNYSTKSFLLGGFLILQWPILETGKLSPEVTSQYMVSCMQLARSAQIGLFLHRYELVMIVFFAISSLVQVMMCILCASIAAKHVVGVNNINKLFIPIALILGGFGYWIVEDHMRAMELLQHYWPLIAVPILIGVTLLIFLLGTVFKKKLANQPSGEQQA